MDDSRSVIISTNLRNQFKFDLPEMKANNLLHDNEKINCSIFHSYYTIVAGGKSGDEELALANI